MSSPSGLAEARSAQARPAILARIAADLPRWIHDQAEQMLWRRWVFPNLRVAQVFGRQLLSLVARHRLYPRLCVEGREVRVSLPVGGGVAETGCELARAIEGLNVGHTASRNEARMRRVDPCAGPAGDDLYLTALFFAADRAHQLGDVEVARQLLSGQAPRLRRASRWLRGHWLWLASLVWRQERPVASEALLWRSLADLSAVKGPRAASDTAGLLIDLVALCRTNCDSRRASRLRGLLHRLDGDASVQRALIGVLERAQAKLRAGPPWTAGPRNARAAEKGART